MQDNIKLIRDTFLDNEDLLIAMRRVAYGVATDTQKDMVKKAMSNEEVLLEVRKRLLPSITDDYKIGNVGYEWSSLTQMVFGQSKDTIAQAIGYKKKSIDLTRKCIQAFADPHNVEITLSLEPVEGDDLAIELIGESQYIEHIEKQLSMLYAIAENNRDDKDAQTKKAIKDSSE